MAVVTAIRAVLFDAVGTFLYPDPPVAVAYQVVGQRFGSPLTVEQITARFSAALVEIDGDSFARRATSEPAERRRWRQIVAAVFHELPGASDPLFDSLWNHFAQPHNWRLYDDAVAAWIDLQRAGFLVGVASNFDDRLAGLCRGLPPMDECQRLFWSARIGHAKPSGAFFAYVQRELGLAPGEILLVGDDYANDYLGAVAAGWHAVLLDRGEKLAISGQRSAVSVIRSLEELPALLNC